MAGRRIATGKLPVDLLARLLDDVPPAPPDVRLGPAVGEDACVIDVRDGILVAASDPITLTGEHVGRYSVIVNANDVAVTGVRPRWFLATLLLPRGATEEDAESLFADIRRALAEVGATLVGGHTEITDAVRQTVVVGTMLGTGPPDAFVTTGGARPDDVLVQVGAVPIEGAAVLATEARHRLEALDPNVVAAAAVALDHPGISVVDAAVRAAERGATAMHDPTEAGLASGLHELALASGVMLEVDRSRVQWFRPGIAVCDALGADPWGTLASGCVVATFNPRTVETAVGDLADAGHTVSIIGRVAPGSGVIDERGATIPWPSRDEVIRVLEH